MKEKEKTKVVPLDKTSYNSLVGKVVVNATMQHDMIRNNRIGSLDNNSQPASKQASKHPLYIYNRQTDRWIDG